MGRFTGDGSGAASESDDGVVVVEPVILPRLLLPEPIVVRASSSPSPSSSPPVSRRRRSSLNAATSWYPWPVSGSLYLAGLPVTAHVAGRGARVAAAPNGGGVDART